MKWLKLSLKVKIFFGIIFILVTSLGFNLLYSLNLFKSDKSAYIFENTLKRATTLENHISTELNTFKKMTYVLSLMEESNSEDVKKQLSSDGSILFTLELTPLDSYENSFNFNNYDNKSFISKIYTPEQIVEQYKVAILKNTLKVGELQLQKLNDKYYFTYTLKNEINGNIFIGALDSTKILAFVNADKAYQNTFFWKESDGTYTAIPSSPDADELKKFLKESNVIKGAKEETFNKAKVILGFSQNRDLRFAVTNSIPYDSAFKITYFLIFKTLIWAAILLGIVAVAGVFFTASIVSPIKTLTEAAREIANGKLDIQIKLESKDEFLTLATAFEYMIQKIKSLLKAQQVTIEQLKVTSAELANLNKHLELKILERTRELNISNQFMQAMVNSLNQGLVVFDNTLICNKIHTDATRTILGQDPSGRQFTELLGLAPEDQATLIEWAKIIFTEMIPFESAAALAPAEKIWGDNIKDPDYKHVTIEYFPMRSQIGKLENIVAVATDKTREIQAIADFQEIKAKVDMLIKVLKGKKQFISFLNEVENIFEKIDGFKNREHTMSACEDLMLLFHTLNGGFGLYQLLDQQRLARSCETQVDIIVKSETIENHPNWENLYTEYLNLINSFKDKIKEIEALLGFDISGKNKMVEITEKDFTRLQKSIPLIGNAEIKDFLNNLLIKEELYEYLKGYVEFVELTAAKTGKSITPLKIEHADIKINMAPYMEFFNTLIHIFRNSIDHGIEFSNVRSSLGKSPEGHIAVKASINSNQLVLEISDDGGGINVEKIKAKLASLNYQHNFTTDEELINVIFEPFFSTKDEVSALSGRGVGMSSVKEAAEKLGGKVEIKTEFNVGTTFIFKLPMISDLGA